MSSAKKLIRTLPVVSDKHRRRIKTEEKAKVVTAVRGTELIQFLAALAISHQDDSKKRMNRIMNLAEWMLWKKLFY